MKKRIIFVDDEQATLNSLQRMLSDRDEVWEMVFVTCVDEAMEEIERAEVDTVVSDVRMPEKDGFDLLRLLRSSDRTKDTPVVIVTGVSESSYKRNALALGASDLLNKPVRMEDLVARIESGLRLKSIQDQLKAHNDELEEKVKARTFQLEASQLDIIWRLGKAAEFKDKETGYHVVRVASYCQPLAESLGLDSDFIERLFLASPLHDIGKIGIPDTILSKPGGLTADEWAIMKTHCRIGAAILRHDSLLMKVFRQRCRPSLPPGCETVDNPVLQMASTIALTHHEKWDGSGYPNGLAKEDIPLESRLVALADAYDALRSDRPYKKALPEDEVLRIIRSDSGVHFDPQVIKAFDSSIEEMRWIRREFSDSLAINILEAEPPVTART